MTAVKTIPNDIFFSQVMELIGEGQSVTIMVSGRSMRPTFKDKVDKLVISPFNPDDLKVGDVVLFNRGDTICVHRIIRRDGDSLVIRGDGNGLNALEPVKVGAVMGLVTGGTMFGGRKFNTADRVWTENTRRILKYFPVLAFFRRIWMIACRYPLSIMTSIVLLYLSFFNPAGKEMPSIVGFDKLAHILMYFGTSLVFWFEWLRWHLCPDRKLVRGFVFCMLAPIALGGAIELVQEYFVEYRGGEWLDFLSDIVGSVAATAFSFAVTLPLLKKLAERHETRR